MEIYSPAPDPLLDEKQAAEILAVKPETLQVWRCTKRYALAYVKVGRNVRYRRSAVEAFMQARTVAA
jgi:excisionase family DNA binding protein